MNFEVKQYALNKSIYCYNIDYSIEGLNKSYIPDVH